MALRTVILQREQVSVEAEVTAEAEEEEGAEEAAAAGLGPAAAAATEEAEWANSNVARRTVSAARMSAM